MVLHRHIVTLDVADFVEAITECSGTLDIIRRAGDESDNRHRRLLRARCERPSGRAADDRDELSPQHELPSAEDNLAHHWTISAPVHRSEIFPLMSVQGQIRPFDDTRAMSGLAVTSGHPR